MSESIGRPADLGAGRPIETRWPCPVCLGVSMQKIHINGKDGTLTLDYCTRCGGLWFEPSEVGRLAKRSQAVFRDLVPEQRGRVRPPCHGCQAPLDRDAERCGVCGTANVIDCPACDVPMERRAHAGLLLDVCRKCHGVWFDNAELSAIWRMNVGMMRSRRDVHPTAALEAGGDVLLSTLFWAPDLVVYGGMAAGEAAGAVGEVAVQAAGGVFEFVMEIISGLFD